MAAANFTSLTSKQKKVYTVIETYIRMKGIPPTVREIGEMVGEKTPGAVQGILNRLEQKGVIKRQLGAARSIQLITSESQMYTDPVYIPEIKKVSKRNIDDLTSIYNVSKYHPFSTDLLPDGQNCLIYRCSDDQSDVGVNNGDVLVIDTQAPLADGDLVLALYDTHVLMRKYYPDKQTGKIRLEGNTIFIPQDVFDSSEIRIVGKITAKFTKF